MKEKIKNTYCKFIHLLLVIFIIALISKYINIASDNNVRVISIDLPFYKSVFYQDLK